MRSDRELDNLLRKRDQAELIRFLEEDFNLNPAKIYASAIIHISHLDERIRTSHGLNRWNDKLSNSLAEDKFVDLTYFYKAFYLAKHIFESEDVANAIRDYVAAHIRELVGVLDHPSLQKSYVTMICADFPIPPRSQIKQQQPSLAVVPAAFFAYREEQRDNNRSLLQTVICGCTIV